MPDDSCPFDALDHFRRLLDRYPDVHKVGFGLRIDDLPETYVLRSSVVQWERQFWCEQAEPGVFRAIDTTFAMYRPRGTTPRGAGGTADRSAVRRTPPAVVRRHQQPRCRGAVLPRADPTVSNWNRDAIVRWKHRQLIDARRASGSGDQR